MSESFFSSNHPQFQTYKRTVKTHSTGILGTVGQTVFFIYFLKTNLIFFSVFLLF
jgi:hypothetical protein